jgi:hypothetical protein
MALLRILGLMLAWLFTPANLLATAATTAVSYSWGYVEGYGHSSKTVDSRVAAGLRLIRAKLATTNEARITQSKEAADAVQPPPPVAPGPRGRDALLGLCRSDPACRRGGS